MKCAIRYTKEPIAPPERFELSSAVLETDMLPLHQRDVCWNDKIRTYNLPRIRRMISPLSYIPILSDKQDSNLRAPHPKCGEIDLTPLLSVIVNPNGLEPLTPSLKVRCSNQLSYEFILWRKLVTLQLLWIFSPLLLLS